MHSMFFTIFLCAVTVLLLHLFRFMYDNIKMYWHAEERNLTRLLVYQYMSLAQLVEGVGNLTIQVRVLFCSNFGSFCKENIPSSS
jgi:hypothetical protein